MGTFIDLKNGQYIIDDRADSNAPVLRALAEKRAFVVNAHDLPDSAEINPLNVAARIRELADMVNGQFVGRHDLIEMTATALVGGDHAFVQSGPGTGKSRIFRLFAEGVGGKFWAINMAKDITREMVFGAPKLAAIRAGEWDRAWTGLATCAVALIDEIWEASSAVTTMLKTVLEERIIEEADVRRNAPLLSAFAASNSMPDAGSQAADWDRWLYRVPVQYLDTATNMRALAYASAGAVPIGTVVEPQDVLMLNAYVDYLAANPTEELVQTWLELWAAMRADGVVISDRRWKRMLRSAVADSVLNGHEQVTGRSLRVARWMVWDDVSEYERLAQDVLGMVDPVVGRVLEVEKLVEALVARNATVTESDWGARVSIASAAGGLVQMISQVKDAANGDYGARLATALNTVERINQEVGAAWDRATSPSDLSLPRI